MLDKGGGLLGEIMEQGVSIAKQTVKAVVTTPVAIVGGIGTQVTGTGTASDATQSVSSENLTSANTSDPKKTDIQQIAGQQKKPAQSQNEVVAQVTGSQRTPGEQKQIETLRRELHSKYYQTLTAPPKREESKQEQQEEEKQEKMADLQVQQKEEKKKEPIQVTRAKGKTERFRGVSG